MPPLRRPFIAALPAIALVLVAAVSLSPDGRWSGRTDMAHGKLPLEFSLTPGANGWTGRAVLGDTDLAGKGVAVDSLVVDGNTVGFAFELVSDMGTAHIRIDGTTTGTEASGTISLSSGGLVIDRGTWTAKGGTAGVP